MTENNKQTANIKRVLRYIREQYKKFPKSGLISLTCRVITIVLSVLPALFYKEIIDFLATTLSSPEMATHAIAILMYIFRIKLTHATVMRVMDRFLINFETDMMEDMYNSIFEYIQKHSFQFFSDHLTGSLISKIRKCVRSIESFTDNLNRGGIDFVLQVILILIIVGLQNIWIAAIFFVVIVSCTIAQYKLFHRISPYQTKANQLDSELGGILADNITNNFNIKTFASLARETKKFAATNHANFKARKTYFYKSMRIRGISR